MKYLSGFYASLRTAFSLSFASVLVKEKLHISPAYLKTY